ncbi:hypothetical protein QAD02_014850 [Eretmocerus hayati]|uniref:Uncharacterized protein n=1 Tax=Eretmocerus hayati TaxID=131215 RepID=A0ACC2P7I2_9HYME|nr:hypothetical protein QAD02_014850 [Eretmocerus hayati]
MVNFIIENPELVTHSSTKENEDQLWQDLVIKLNNLKPKKSVDMWKQFWKRWVKILSEKPESKLLVVESKLRNFLNKILLKPDVEEKLCGRRKFTTKEEIDEYIARLEKEKSKLTLDFDDNEAKIYKYRIIAKNLEMQNSQRRKRINKINEKKKYCLTKRKKIEEQCNKRNTEILVKQENL